MQMRTLVATVGAAAALAIPAHRAAAQAATQDTAYHPRNVKEAASNTGHEAKRVGKRSEKAVVKAADDTKKQGARTVNWAKRTVSKKERDRQAAEKAEKQAASRPR